jgi:hypothetical protein
MPLSVLRRTLSLIPVALTLGPAPAPAATPTTPDLNLGLACASGVPMWMSTQIPPPITAVIVKILPRTVALHLITKNERVSGATIDPAYLNNERVMVRGHYGKQGVVLVPLGMTVHIGDVVTFVPGHADPNNLCSYIPNLIVAVPSLNPE